MVRTDQAYINQYLVYDEVFEACDACEKACVEADYFLRKEARKSYLDTYFSEALNFGAKKSTSKTEDNVFAKIGKAIVNLIEKIKNAIKHITDSILGTQRRTEKANKDLQKILAENPEMKKTIMKGLKQEWFTVYDVAGYKNDIMGLIKMVDQAKIDNQSAMDKFKEATAKFVKGTVAAGAGAGGIAAIMKAVTEANKQRASLRDMLTDINKVCEAKKAEAEKNNEKAKAITPIIRIISSTVTVLTGADRKYLESIDGMTNVMNVSNRAQDDRKKGAAAALNKYYASVVSYVDTAAGVISKNAQEYRDAKAACDTAYKDMENAYSDFINLDRRRFAEFEGKVDEFASVTGTKAIEQKKILIDMGRFPDAKTSNSKK